MIRCLAYAFKAIFKSQARLVAESCKAQKLYRDIIEDIDKLSGDKA